MTDLLRLVPTTVWPWMVIGATIILVIVGLNPQAGSRIITFLQQIKDLLFAPRRERAGQRFSRANKGRRP
jgi:hypothetical protein